MYMALHIFRFIPFSIPFRFPFRFPFRVLVTPKVAGCTELGNIGLSFNIQRLKREKEFTVLKPVNVFQRVN